MHKIRSLESLRRSPDPLVGWRGDRRLRRLYSRAFGTRLGACGVSILPYHFYVRGTASGNFNRKSLVADRSVSVLMSLSELEKLDARN